MASRLCPSLTVALRRSSPPPPPAPDPDRAESANRVCRDGVLGDSEEFMEAAVEVVASLCSVS